MEIVTLFLNLLIFVFVYIFGVVHGWNARERHAIKVTNKIVKRIEQEVEEEVKSLVHITIEEHNGVFYVYNKKDNSFMAQGKTKDEIESVLNSRFPGSKFAASEEELKMAGLIS